MLVAHEISAYRMFFERTNAIVVKAVRAPELREKRLPVGLMGMIDTECAMWLRSYHRTEMCPTYVRHRNVPAEASSPLRTTSKRTAESKLMCR